MKCDSTIGSKRWLQKWKVNPLQNHRVVAAVDVHGSSHRLEEIVEETFLLLQTPPAVYALQESEQVSTNSQLVLFSNLVIRQF